MSFPKREDADHRGGAADRPKRDHHHGEALMERYAFDSLPLLQ